MQLQPQIVISTTLHQLMPTCMEMCFQETCVRNRRGGLVSTCCVASTVQECNKTNKFSVREEHPKMKNHKDDGSKN